ncbi:hypothetical protein X975_25104, partial [Stegodyphus mimosarum]
SLVFKVSVVCLYIHRCNIQSFAVSTLRELLLNFSSVEYILHNG